ncbi:MAG: ArnT family glycosyltransferase [Planctomycetaceae bacterium]
MECGSENHAGEPEPHGSVSRRFRLRAFAIAGFGVFLVFFELGGHGTLTKHEAFVAVVGREMCETGDWVVPRFGGLPRLKKPPLMYWCAAASGSLFGRHAAWTARFPSAVAALLLAALVGWWAARWYGRNAGLAAGLIQISCVYVISFARKAEVDVLLCLLTTAALFLVAEYRPEERRRRAFARWAGILGLVGVSWLAKFHYGPAMVLSVSGVWLLSQRWFGSLRHLCNPAGLAILAAAAFVWPYLLLQQLPEAWRIWQSETVGRAVGRLGRQPVWFYVPQIVVQTLPWAPLLWIAVPESWRRAWKDADRRERFLWIWFGTQFAILSASAFKHHHYLMAALPALSLVMGRSLARLVKEFRTGERQLRRRDVVRLCAAFVGTAVAAPVILAHKWPYLLAPGVVAGACIGVGGVAGVCLLGRRRFSPAVLTAAVAALGCYVVVMGWIFPGRDRRVANVQFAESVNTDAGKQPVCVFGLKEHPVVYYLNPGTYRLEDERALATRLRKTGRLLVVTDVPKVAALSQVGTVRPLRTVSVGPNRPRPKRGPLTLLELTAAQTASQDTRQRR